MIRPAIGSAGASPPRGVDCRLEGVVVAYGATLAVGPVSLHLPAGQSVALVGPSGAGKTSLLRVLAGLVAPTAGHVTIGGRPMGELRGSRALARLVGLASQRLDLVPQLSVKHNVQAGALGRWGLVRSIAALVLPLEHPPARQAVSSMGLGKLFDRRVGDLSGGEQQRVALARLLVQDPLVMLADEPVASLDPARADHLLGLLRAASVDDGRTLVASLHLPDLARRHFDRIIGMREGRIVFDLPSSEVTAEGLDGLYRLLETVDGVEPEVDEPPADVG